MHRAHRLVWELSGRQLAPGMVLDHLCHDPATCPGGTSCRHRLCVNPDHLQQTTPAANAARRSPRWRGRCARGHDVSTAGAVYVRPNGDRECRACRAAARHRGAA